MKKIVTIIGARPQFIKAAPLSKVLRNFFQEIIINTGQHYDYNMAGVFFDELNIPKPDYDLGVGSSTHGKQTGEMLMKIEEVLLHEKPDGVIVYGDTNSTLAGAICASKLHIPLFHIESGLRSFNKEMPEEINRILTDHASTLLFVPTVTAVSNLKNEGIEDHVYQVGDVMYDTYLQNMKISEGKYQLTQFELSDNSYYLATIHRAENTDNRNRLKAIFESFLNLKQEIVLPIHPRTVRFLKEEGLYTLLQENCRLKVIDPVSYLEMIFLETHAKGIITDSGGVQKEAYFARVPCFTLRDETEWVETVEIGWNQLIDPLTMNLSGIISSNHNAPYVKGLYGDGRASEKIVEYIKQYFA
jgi:UDP-GlcNAc3NAcA epimerase